MSQPAGPAAKTERLLNLVLCLLYTRTPMPKSRIRDTVEQYRAAPSDEAFDRMFERDKEELRELGIPLVTEDLNSIWEDEPGYRIDQRDYALPEITFETDELAVLGLASRVWAQASLAGEAAEAMRKLRASDVDRDEESLIGIEPRLRTAEPAFAAVKDAVVDRTPITFDYRKGTGQVMRRHLQPWGLASWHGRWYVTGLDLDRDAERVFRLSRIVGIPSAEGQAGEYAVPADHQPVASIQRAFPERPAEQAVVSVRAGAGNTLRRRAIETADTDGWTRLTVEHRALGQFAEEIATFGPDARAEEPAELVTAVTQLLQGAIDAQRAPVAPEPPAPEPDTAKTPRRSPETATARLTRLLTMVPWLVNRQGIDVAEAAKGLGVTEKQLEADLSLLFLCGYGTMPDQLIDAEWDGGHVYVRNAETIERPLRLGRDEAVTLLVGLRLLAAMPGLTERDAVDRAAAKITEAAGADAEAATRVEVSVDDAADAQVVATAREAVERHRRLHLRYLVPGRDESTERDVDPFRVVGLDAHWYLEGWCHRAQDTRLFRLDRVEEIEILDVDGTPPAGARPRDLADGAFVASADDLEVTLDLTRDAAWVPDYYPVESVLARPEGGARVTLRTGDLEWLVRLLWRLGGTARAVAPDSLGEEVCRGAEAALAAYPPASPASE
ncbi:helix-turn-helix transcriptional regulator [Actinomycetota bacterium]